MDSLPRYTKYYRVNTRYTLSIPLNGFWGWVSKFRVTESVVLSIPLNGFIAAGIIELILNDVDTFNSIEWILERREEY